MFEIIADVASVGYSTYQLLKNPSWINAGYLLWDVGASALPFIPGSYASKVGKATRHMDLQLVARAGKSVFKNIDEGLNFTNTTAKHMDNVKRYIPVETLRDAIKSTKGVTDPRGTDALMHYTTMFKNGKKYNLEVLYDKATNTIMHFKYTQKSIGPLDAIK